MPWKGHCTNPRFVYDLLLLVSGVGKRRREQAAEEKMKMIIFKRPKKATPEGTSDRAHRDKGKELVEVAESPNYPPTVRELHEVALECLWAKYPDLLIEEDPIAERPKDASVRMEVSQPFDDSTPPED
ncbi:hypothetical protein B296_00002525 [Ensete ventricosum]|uniref:Uncharacterized protein n=1 Tax=Ensete ventricosum TaxID=4639 RepID=A0A427AUB0_ENSVE|nr:hypothetical protein B296_00002525 [Ensete ventricosum]